MVISWNSNFETVFSCCWLRRANGKALWGLPFGLAPRLPASARGFKCNKNRRKLNWKNLTNFFHPWVSPKGFFSRKFGKQELRNYDFAVWLFTVKLFIGQTQIALLQNGLLRFNEKKPLNEFMQSETEKKDVLWFSPDETSFWSYII